MNYIVFDLEFNQDLNSLQVSDENAAKCPFEIIQIGAVKLDSDFHTAGTFNRYIKPSIYLQVNPFITELTGISTDQLLSEETFPEVLDEFIKFIGEDAFTTVIWGMSDMKELYRNADYHRLDKKSLPEMFINLQPYVSTFLNDSPKKLPKLQTAVETFNITTPYSYHNALHDAYYTAEILKKIYNPAILPKRYSPNYVTIRPRQPKKVIDFERLLQQFEKMYARELSVEEQDMIKLAYKMGRTQQFLK